MKNFMLLLAALLSLSTCQKEPAADLVFSLSGQVLDIQTRQPVPNVRVYIDRVYIPCFICDIEFTNYGRATTGSDGRFDMVFQLEKASDRGLLHLKLESIPGGYQFGARVNGSDQPCIADHGFSELLGFEPLADGSTCLIELIPYSFVSVRKPAIPQEWAQDTLFLNAENFCLSWGCTSDFCSTLYDARTFKMNDYTGWQSLIETKGLRFGNTARLTYEVRNGVLKARGETQVECPYGDTAVIEMNFKH